MNQAKHAIRAAFPHTIPVLTGYLFLGMAYGIYMRSAGFHFLYSTLISACVFAGSLQFVMVNLLVGSFAPLYAFALTLMVNARHLFYGVAMLDRYQGVGRGKWYMIFGLTDETFSVAISAEPPAGIDKNKFLFWITLMDQCYWVLGATLGGLVGSLFTFNTQGIDFVMTALFVVIFLEQWLNSTAHRPAMIGLGASALCLLMFGADGFILPAMALILALLMALKAPLEREGMSL